MRTTIFASALLWGPELELRKDQLVTIDDGTIVSIKQGTQDDAELVLEKDHVLMPGMIDAHTHLALDARLPGHLDLMEDAESKQTIRALKTVHDNLHAGITGLRSVGDRYYLDVLLRDMINKGTLEGPWMQVAGIGMKGLHGHGYVGKSFSGKEEFRRQARENMFNHTDWLKIFITAGAPPKGDHVNCFLTREEVQTVVQEASSCGIKTSAHCIGGQGLRYCTEEGIDVLDHCYWVDQTDIDLIMQHDTTVCFTPGVFMDDSRLPLCPQGHVDSVLRTREQVIKRLSNLVEAKPRFVLGSDAYHGNLYKEIEYMVALGMSRTEALKGITVYAGFLMDQSVGVLQEGYRADLIAVKENPLDTPNALAEVSFVMRQGVQIR
ncbi:amidohydrolase family protein [uncultured Sphaerochaeta sp.]|uniref:amidohydrolase family protein n=1 Tax=uncultured Sphaerochaeta sp. TaxID=886478 RepID=UPI0029C9B8FB|nr:amidohydrolase family protein [uncultured Sphaerochaeta sp.]